MIADKLGYVSQATTTGVQVGTAGPRGFFGITSTVTGGLVTVYDGTSTSGTIVFSKTLSLGETVHFGGNGIACKNGIFLVVAAGTVVLLYT